MRLFGIGRRKKSKEEEEEDDEDEEDDEEEEDTKKKPSRKKFKDLNPENRGRRKAPPKPWGKKERFLIFAFFGGTTLVSAILAASARSWALPGVKNIEMPAISFQQEYKFESEEVKQTTNNQNVISSLKSLTANYSGIYASYIVDLEKGNSYGVEEDKLMQAASLIKLPVMAALYKEAESGRIDLDSVYSLKTADKVSGSGSLYYKAEGTKITFRELAELMGKQSDNTAFRIIRKTIGDGAINTYMKQMGMDKSNLDENLTTPAEVGLFFKKLYNSQIVNKEHSEEILGYLTDTIYEDWIPTYVDEGVKVAHKYGSEVHVINDAGIVYTNSPFVMVVMTDGIVDAEAAIVLPEVIRLLYSYQTGN